uniref:Uncharacterized protein n=1 Tax=Boodleopsis pusilla TaxID=381415 RepID=A0A386AZK4_9CHLO|nr:hypothetical protein Ycf47 [Boodleopsis pusilla]AYC64876.1 hypothetical protein Ycf47 [Boodleopsis pusilla]
MHWNALAYFFLFLWLFLPFRVFIGCFIVFVLEPQMPLWNPLIDRTRHLFLTYGEAKHFLIKFTWISIGIFTFLHLRRYV